MCLLSAFSILAATILCFPLAFGQDCGPAYTSAGIEATTFDGDFCAFTVQSDLGKPRGVIVVGDTVLVVEAQDGANKISAHWFEGPSSLTLESMTVIDANGIQLNHGIAYYGGFLYASSETTGEFSNSFSLCMPSHQMKTGCFSIVSCSFSSSSLPCFF